MEAAAMIAGSARAGRARRASAAAALLGLVAGLIAVPATAAPGAGTAPARQAARKAARPPVAAPATTAADSVKAPWGEARHLADEGRHDSSLVVIRRALERHPDNVDLRWLEAGVTGWAGRHREAVTLYERLIADHPEVAGAVRTDLATERLAADDPKGALREIDLRLADDPADRDARRLRALALSHANRLRESLAAYDRLLREQPGDRDLTLERARVLGWMGRHREASAAYRGLLERDPADRSAQFGLAQNENWAGHHRRAAALFQAQATGEGADPEIYKGLAFAHDWAGEPDAARRALDAYLERVPTDREGLELSRRLAREEHPDLALGVGRSDDSDGLRVRTTHMELRWPLPSQTTAVLGWRRDNVQDPGGTRDPLSIGGGIEKIWSATWSTRGYAYYVDAGDSAGTAGLGEAAVTWRPADQTRFDFGLSRDLVMTRLSLAKGISAQTWVAGVDWDPVDRLGLHADARLRRFSDDNRAERFGLAARWRLCADRRANLHLTLAVEQLRTRFDLDHGYYDPALYREWGPGAEAEWNPSETVSLAAHGQTGWQRERGAETKPFYNVSASAGVEIARALRLSIEGGRSNSNLQSETGYERRWWAASIGRSF
jgi:tetratricopeptide (TPR) repeat protein